jgi:Flp pilus assembly protein TadD
MKNLKKSILALFLLALPLAAQQPTPATASDKALEEAFGLMHAGNLAGAIQKLEPLRNQPGVNPRMMALLGALYVQTGQYQPALDVLKPLADAEDADAAVLYNAGRAALAGGLRDLGRSYLMRSVRQTPESPAARDLGMLLAREGRVVEAYSLLRPWVLKNPTDADPRMMAASIAVQLERPEEAEQFLANLPADPALAVLRGRARTQRGDAAGALALLKPLLANHPPGMETEVRRALAEAHLAAGQPAEAVKLLTGRAGTYPSLALLLGKAQRAAGDAAGALATLKPMVDKIPDDPAAVGDPRQAVGIAVEYASLLAAAGRAAEAVPVLEKATRIHPGSAEAWQALAQALDAAGRAADAGPARAKAGELAAKAPAASASGTTAAALAPLPALPAPTAPAAPAPSAPAAANARPAAPAPPATSLSKDMQEALRLATAGQDEQALAAVRRELAASPGNLQVRKLETHLLLRLNRVQEARKSNDDAVALAPEDPDVIYQRGAIEMSQRNVVAAERDLRRVIQLSPGHTAAMNDLAVLLLSQNKKKEAQEMLQRVLQLNPQDKVAAANLQRITAEGQQPQ